VGILRCKGIENHPERAIFRILLDDQPASLASVTQVARLGDVLLRENELAGRFIADAEGTLALELPEGKRTFFHNGIVFAALDAFNDPVKNPTLTLLAEPDTK
jgi:hypothetical protein